MKLVTANYLNSNHYEVSESNEEIVLWQEDIKKEDVKEEVAQTTEEVVEESNQPSES